MIIIFEDHTWRHCDNLKEARNLYTTHSWGDNGGRHEAVVLDDYAVMKIFSLDAQAKPQNNS